MIKKEIVEETKGEDRHSKRLKKHNAKLTLNLRKNKKKGMVVLTTNKIDKRFHVAKPTLAPEEHFDLSALTIEMQKRKVGRPFKGDVDKFTKEPFVPERRSVLRGFKKFYAKKEFYDIKKI